MSYNGRRSRRARRYHIDTYHRISPNIGHANTLSCHIPGSGTLDMGDAGELWIIIVRSIELGDDIKGTTLLGVDCIENSYYN